MITVVGGIKGGSGKTTIATNLAVMRSEHTKVLLVDADEQKSAWDWSQQRDHLMTPVLNPSKPIISKGPESHLSFVTVCMSGKAIYSNLLKMKDDYDDIIVDTGGRDTTSQRAAISVADNLILPFKPSSIDIWTMVPIKSILDECLNHRLKVYAIISQADAKGKDNEEAIGILGDFQNVTILKCMIGSRKAFRNAAAEGMGVIELDPQDKKACKEMEELYMSIYS
jgi:chromosome partitioning protein